MSGAGAAAGAAGAAETQAYQAAYKAYQEKKVQYGELVNKVEKFDTDLRELEVVIGALSSVEPTRPAYSLVGGVLVERTAADTIPRLKATMQNMTKVKEALIPLAKQRETEVAQLMQRLQDAAKAVRAAGAAARGASA